MNLFSKNAKLKSLLDNLHLENEKQLIFQARSQFNGTDEEFQQLLAKYNTYNAIEKGKLLEEYRIKIQSEELDLSVSPEMGQFLCNMQPNDNISLHLSSQKIVKICFTEFFS